MLTTLLIALLSADAGAPRLDVKQLVEQALLRDQAARGAERKRVVADLKRRATRRCTCASR